MAIPSDRATPTAADLSLESTENYPCIALSSYGNSSPFYIWSRGDHLRFGSGAGDVEKAAFYIKNGDAGDVEFNGQIIGRSEGFSFAGTLLGNVTGDLTGNADTATKLQSEKTITLTGDVSGTVTTDFSSNDIDIFTTAVIDSIVLGDNTTGQYLTNVIEGTNISVTAHDGSDGSTQTINVIDAPVFSGAVDIGGAITAGSTIIASGNVTAPIFIGALSGNADTSTKFLDDKTISLTGDVTGTVTSDFGNTIASSYLKFEIVPKIVDIAINKANTPKSSGEYIRVKIGEIAKGKA